MSRISLILVSFALLLTACIQIEVEPAGFPYERLLSGKDLEGEWTVEQDSFHEVPGASASYAVTFQPFSEEASTNPYFAEQLTVYPDPSSASESWQYWQGRFLYASDEGGSPIAFDPIEASDMYVDQCKTIIIDEVDYQSCVHIQQHRNFVLTVGGLMDGTLFPIDRCEELLAQLDAKLSSPTGG